MNLLNLIEKGDIFDFLITFDINLISFQIKLFNYICSQFNRFCCDNYFGFQEFGSKKLIKSQFDLSQSFALGQLDR